MLAAIIHRVQHPDYAFDPNAVKEQINWKTFPNKLEYIENRLGIPVDAGDKADALSINKARNCFVHRRGIVTRLDLNDKAAAVLRVSWTAPVPEVEYPDGTVQELQIGELIPANSMVHMPIRRNIADFDLGSPLTFSARQFGEIGLMFMFQAARFGDAILQEARRQRDA